MSELRLLGTGGDVKISWDSRKDDEVDLARETFDKRIKAGWAAFRDKGGFKGDRIKTFDPEAERIILLPPISGGTEITDTMNRLYRPDGTLVGTVSNKFPNIIIQELTNIGYTIEKIKKPIDISIVGEQ